MPWEPPVPPFESIAQSFRKDIAEGRLRAGERIPSATKLADQLGVSRNTVVKAMSRLRQEGYLESRPGYGTFVRDQAAASAGSASVASEMRSLAEDLRRLADQVERLGPPGGR